MHARAVAPERERDVQVEQDAGVHEGRDGLEVTETRPEHEVVPASKPF